MIRSGSHMTLWLQDYQASLQKICSESSEHIIKKEESSDKLQPNRKLCEIVGYKLNISIPVVNPFETEQISLILTALSINATSVELIKADDGF